FAFVFLAAWVLIFSSFHAGIAVGTMAIWLWLFRFWQWIEVSNLIFGFILLIAIVVWIVEAMKRT
ncbi:hypothetical protein LCGC14_3091000, partial [marine sediment metagenome]